MRLVLLRTRRQSWSTTIQFRCYILPACYYARLSQHPSYHRGCQWRPQVGVGDLSSKAGRLRIQRGIKEMKRDERNVEGDEVNWVRLPVARSQYECLSALAQVSSNGAIEVAQQSFCSVTKI